MLKIQRRKHHKLLNKNPCLFIVQTAITFHANWRHSKSYHYDDCTAILVPFSMLPPAGGISLRAISAICRVGCECICRVLVLRAIRGTMWQTWRVQNVATSPYTYIYIYIYIYIYLFRVKRTSFLAKTIREIKDQLKQATGCFAQHHILIVIYKTPELLRISCC
jgi:hypothetical protein